MTVWRWSSAGSGSGNSARACAPRVSSRASAEARRAGRAGAGRRAARAGPARVALEAGEPPDRLAGLAVGAGREVSARGVAVACGGGSSSPAQRGAAAEHEALRERVRGEPVRAVQAGAGALADGVQAGHAARAAVEVGHDPAHHVVAGGRDRDALGRRVQPGLAQRLDDVREAPGVDVAHVEVDRGRAGLAQQVEDRPGDRVARRELVDEALAVGAVQRRALAADRLGDQEALAALDARSTAVGWNWVNSRSASAAPASRASIRPEPNEPGGLVVRDHSAAAPPVARIVARARRARARPRAHAVRGRRGGRPARGALEHLDAFGSRRPRPRARAGSGGRSRCRRRARCGAGCGRPRARARGRRGGRRRSGRRAPAGRARARRLVGHSTSAGGAADEAAAGGRACPRGGAAASRPPPARRRRRPAPSRTRSRRAAGRRRASRARPRAPRSARRRARPRRRRPRRGRCAR